MFALGSVYKVLAERPFNKRKIVLYSIIKNLIAPLILTFIVMLIGLRNTHAEEAGIFTEHQNIKGVAVYEELGIEYYVASISLANDSLEGKELLQFNGNQSIKIKVTTKRWSARKWKAQWQNNIAINNEPTSDINLIENLAHFTQFPRGSLQHGDEVIVSYYDGGSHVTFNGHSVLTTANKNFYSYILNTWLGKFSPNRIFREKLSGNHSLDPKLLALSQETVELNRLENTKTWFSVDQAKAEKKLQQERLAKKQKERVSKERNKLIANEEALLKEQKRLEAIKTKKILQEKAEKKARILAEEKARKIKEQQKKALERKQRLAWLEKQKKLALIAAEKEKQRALNEQKYLYELYQWQLQVKLNEVVVYPPWARQFNQEGSVSLEFNLNRAGNLSAMNSNNSLASKILVQEVEKRLNFVVESYPVPKDLKGNHWAFSINYIFDLRKSEQEILTKPQLLAIE